MNHKTRVINQMSKKMTNERMSQEVVKVTKKMWVWS